MELTLNDPTVPKVLDLLKQGHKPSKVFHGSNVTGQFSARIDLWLIRAAWNRGCNFESLCDGMGLGNGTMGEWSALRDSSGPAIDAMYLKAKRYLK